MAGVRSLAAAGLLAAAALVAPTAASAGAIDSLWIAPTPGSAYEYVGALDCIGEKDALWSTIPYVNIDIKKKLSVTGQVQTIGGFPAPGHVVNVWFAGFRQGEFQHPKRLARITAGAEGFFSFKSPKMLRNGIVWTEVDAVLLGDKIGQCGNPSNWPLVPGISDPIVIDVRPTSRSTASRRPRSAA